MVQNHISDHVFCMLQQTKIALAEEERARARKGEKDVEAVHGYDCDRREKTYTILARSTTIPQQHTTRVPLSSASDNNKTIP